MGEERIELKMIIRATMRYWYLFALALPIFLGAAYFYLSTTQPEYKSSALLLIKDDEKSGKINEEMFFKDLGLGYPNKNLTNEIHVLNSTPLMGEVVKNLGLQYQYFSVKPWTEWDLYKDTPIRVSDWQPIFPGATLYAVVKPDNKGGYHLKLELEKEELEFTGDFGKMLELPVGILTLTHIGGKKDDDPIAIRIQSIGGRAWELVQNLSVERIAKDASILSLTYSDVAPERTRDVLRELIKVYNQRTVDSENQVFRNTIDLINERINLINDELSEAERDVQAYKQQFSMIELSSEGNLIMNEMAGYNKGIAETEVQLAILQSIEEFLIKDKDNFNFVPTNMHLTNLTLDGQLQSFNQLLADKEKLSRDWGPSHPDLQLVDRQIRNMRETIIENIRSMRTDLLIARDSNKDLRQNLQNRLQSLPRRERELIEIERRKNIKENLYVYLLQKREESAISMAVTMAKGEVVEPPGLPVLPVSPNKVQVWISAGFLGLALPAGLIFLFFQLNDKIQTEEEIESLSSVPVGGVLVQSKNSHRDEKPIVRENSRSAASEMFRMLRANLAYIGTEGNLKSLLITSYVSGEGKSFISLNLAMTLALTGKQVVILEADLRKPKGPGGKPSSNGKVTHKGIVNYLVDPSIKVEQIVNNSGFHPNLDVIHCGPKPPNPGELILSNRLRELVAVLRTQYDFIIFDSPPVGIVADALQMKDLVDATMFVVRAGYTPKAQLKAINNIAQKNKLPKPFIVLNDVKLNNYGYGYGYSSYGYSYVKSNDYFEKEA